MKKSRYLAPLLFASLVISTGVAAVAYAVESNSGVHKIEVQVKPNPATGLTIEQENVGKRLKADNAAGSVKHLYVISPLSGQAVLYSTVQGKVTSSGKRLSPGSMIKKYDCGKDCTFIEGQHFYVNGEEQITRVPIQDDGTYGSSSPYLYWFDAQGRYHQLFLVDGTIVNISSQPMAFKQIVINADVRAKGN